jgi:hypothetical protein
MAVFGTPDEVEKRTAVAVPWVVISDLAYGLRGTHATMRDALGIKGAATPEEAVSRLRRNFPNVPEWLVAGGAAQRLTRDPVGLMGEGGGMGGRDDPPEGPPPKPPGNPPAPGGSGGIVVPPVDLAVEVAKCLVRGKWGPAFGSWWGWAYGFQVCLDQGCADKLAKLLGGLGGGKALADVIGQVAAAESVAAGIKALAVTAAMALALYGLLLAANILAVNWAKGVCLLFNWPVIGGPGMFVIAIAGS